MILDRTIPHGLSLRFLFPDAEFFGAADICAARVASQLDSCQVGDLFVALPDGSRDGHDLAREAAARGASAVLAERLLPIDLPVCVVSDLRQAYGKLCQALHAHPSRELKVIGITGTSGKTTTACLIASILAAAEHRVGVVGSLGYCDSLAMAPAKGNHFDALELAHWLRRMASAGCTHAVVEAPSAALAESQLAGVELDLACLTNIGHHHLDLHGTLSGYCRVKRRIFEHLRPEGLAIFNADDPLSARMMQRFPGPALSAGMHCQAEITATLLERSRSEQTFLLIAGSESIAVRTAMIGDEHLACCLLAATAGLACDMDLTTIARGLENAGQIPGRLERIECGQEFGLFVDHARTPVQLDRALRTLREVTERRLICVFGCEGGHSRTQRPTLGHTAESLADVVVLTSDNPGFEAPEAIADDILSGCQRPHDIELVFDRAAAIERAVRLAEPGDCVLIAGKGAATVQQIAGECRAFDDREIARRCLYSMPSTPLAHFATSALFAGPN